MKRQKQETVPFIPTDRDFYGFAHEQNKFDPLGSYTGRSQDRNEIPVQDADDLQHIIKRAQVSQARFIIILCIFSALPIRPVYGALFCYDPVFSLHQHTTDGYIVEAFEKDLYVQLTLKY